MTGDLKARETNLLLVVMSFGVKWELEVESENCEEKIETRKLTSKCKGIGADRGRISCHQRIIFSKRLSPDTPLSPFCIYLLRAHTHNTSIHTYIQPYFVFPFNTTPFNQSSRLLLDRSYWIYTKQALYNLNINTHPTPSTLWIWGNDDIALMPYIMYLG